MAAPDSTYIFCSPLQEQIWDKDLNVPLAAGVVTFWSDDQMTVPKNVYVQSQVAPFTKTSVGASLTLSGIGTFVDPNNGNNAAIFLWPYQGDPDTATPPFIPEPYFIRVVSSTNIEQFTVANWPPNTQGSSGGSGFNQILVNTYTAGTTAWTPSASMVYATIECMGGGGGGSGTANSAASGFSAGGGGGAGSYSRKTVTLAQVSPNAIVTVGTGGTGGAPGANPGTAGTASSVGSVCVAPGGQGGNGQVSGLGGTAGIGDITGTGQSGVYGVGAVVASQNQESGTGGSTQWGGGGRGSNINANGQPGTGYGSGGSGGTSVSAGGPRIGGNGAPGFVIITEYISA